METAATSVPGSGGLPHEGGEEEEEEEPPKTMTHSMRERLSEKNGPRKTVFGVLSNKKYEVRGKNCGHLEYIIDVSDTKSTTSRGGDPAGFGVSSPLK